VPFGFGRKSERPDLIEVTLVDATSGQRFASTALPAEQLPETFELSTTMHIGSDDWHVESADPIDRAGYVASGRLTLVLRKTENIDPTLILFSLPTLDDALPPMREQESSSAYEMHEDDWRQREFVSRQLIEEIDAEMVEIRKVWAERDGPGFKRAHIRSKIRQPLRGVTLTLGEVGDSLGGIEPVGLVVGGGLVIDGFALPLRGGAAYGRVVDGLVDALGLHGDAEPGGLRGLANQRALVLVDWIRASVD
jgi:hypothetical protein